MTAVELDYDFSSAAPVYELDGDVVYRASSLGGCMRMLALCRQGYERLPVPESMLRVYEQGRDAERQVWTKGWVQGRTQDAVYLPISGHITVVGHLDAWWNGEIYEIKSQSEGEWKPIRESRLWYRYSWQIAVYMVAKQRPLTVVRVLRDKDGQVVDRVEERFTEAPYSLSEIRRRVYDVEALARRELDGKECERSEFPCPFFYTHLRREDREIIEDGAAVQLAVEYRRARLEKVAVDGRVKAARQGLLDFMGDKTKVGVKGWKLTRYTVPAKHVEYDRDAYEVLRVTEPKSKGGVDGKESDAGV